MLRKMQKYSRGVSGCLLHNKWILDLAKLYQFIVKSVQNSQEYDLQ